MDGGPLPVSSFIPRMYLYRLYIENFRSIESLDLTFGKGKNVIVGRNNCGKSNIVKAIDLLLGENSPTFSKSDNITVADFHSRRTLKDGEMVETRASEIYIWCELHRDPEESLDYDQIYKCAGFFYAQEARYGPPLRIDRSLVPEDSSEIFYHDEDSVPAKGYVQPKLRNQQAFEQQFEDKVHFGFAFRATLDECDRIERDIRFLYRESANHDWVLAFRATVRNELLQSAIIPSFRDPQAQLRLAHYTWYGKLMRHLTREHSNSETLKSALERVQSEASKIFSDVEKRVTDSAVRIAFPNTTISFQFHSDAGHDLYKNCTVYIDDGFKSPLSDKGAGIQSATVIGLFTYYTQVVAASGSALLCIEEPEVYLHPHARRVVSDRLDEFLGANDHQVILTTHSGEFIRTTSESLNIIMARKSGAATTAREVDIREFRDLLLDNNQHELFFADKVIVCEGFESYLLRAAGRELFPGLLDEQNVSIVQAGGKDNLVRLAKLVVRLGIPAYVFADFDFLLRDKGPELRKYSGAKAHSCVVDLGKDFFSQDHVCGPRADRAISRLQKLRQQLKLQNEGAFYVAKRADAFEGVELPAVLSRLRQAGICLLSTDIEGQVLDRTILRNGKISLDSVFDLSQRLTRGQNISNIFDLVEMAGFLSSVLSKGSTSGAAAHAV